MLSILVLCWMVLEIMFYSRSKTIHETENSVSARVPTYSRLFGPSGWCFGHFTYTSLAFRLDFTFLCYLGLWNLTIELRIFQGFHGCMGLDLSVSGKLVGFVHDLNVVAYWNQSCQYNIVEIDVSQSLWFILVCWNMMLKWFGRWCHILCKLCNLENVPY